MKQNDTTAARLNATTLEREIEWFDRVLEAVIRLYFEQERDTDDIRKIPPPDLNADESEYARLVKQQQMTFDERMVLVLAMIPHVRPQLLDLLFIRNKNLDRGYAEFGGWHGKYHGGFLPTGETAAFILAGQDLARRFEVIRLFESDHFFASSGILKIVRQTEDEPYLSGALILSADTLSRCTSGISHKPDYSITFPAKLINTRLGWDDLVLAPEVLAEIEVIKTWMRHASTIMQDWGLEKSIMPGYRSLFYGPSGTGKTLTATLIGAELGVDVYRIDLSMVVSKYIGETEKNLANVFDQAQHKNWILFFDEADALFGKRTQTTSSNDRHANQEISYLLQRVEDYPGVVILATNLKANIDEAFARRFQSLVYFPLPDVIQRQQLWENMLSGPPGLAVGVDLARLAQSYQLSGGAITNVVRYGAISALQNNRSSIELDDLVKGVSKELRKEGKTV
ncbi:MAG TPA: ATP-binding protein [Gammaproteobacteria bacterium]|nr:ATP-binding protein [Gammaproteobacteria bacterium]